MVQATIHNDSLWFDVDSKIRVNMDRQRKIQHHYCSITSSISQGAFMGSVQFNSTTPDRRQSKTLYQSTNADQKLQETVFLIAICRPTWQHMAIKNSVSNDF